MGFLKEFGKGAGSLVGGVTGGLIKGVGEITGSKFIEEVGEGVKSSTEFAGKQLGNISEGLWNVGSGLVKKDDRKLDQGFEDLGEGVISTAKAVGQGVTSTAKSVGNVAEGMIDGDEERWKQGLRDVGKTVAVATLGVSLLEIADVVDVNDNEGGNIGIDNNMAVENNAQSNNVHWVDSNTGNAVSVESNSETIAKEVDQEYVHTDNPNNHSVEPHERTLANGETIWIDGDGDSSIDRTAEQGGGWNQSNPDYRTPVDKL